MIENVVKPQVLAALAGRPVHELASQLRRDKDFSHSALRSVIEALPKNSKKHMRKMIDSFAPSSSYTLFGQYTHGGLQGITKATQSNAEVCHYLNSFVKHHAPEDFRWTSVVISVNAKSKLHADVHNLSGSHNFTTSCGNYTGGQLWIEDPLATGPHASTQLLPNGSDLRGSAKSTKHQTVMFDPSSIGIFARLIQPRSFGNIKMVDKLQGVMPLALLRKWFSKNVSNLL